MDLTLYQLKALKTAIYPAEVKTLYPAMGLAGEAGEILNKLKKVYRDKGGEIDDATEKALGAELGDVLWYVAVLANDLHLDLTVVAQQNLDKLADRASRGKIQGEGDER